MTVLLTAAPVVPVLTLDDADRAEAIGRALLKGGLHLFEVTLRTPAALACLRRLAALPGAVVGAGTVLGADGVAAAADAGAAFVVSPGLTATVVDAARACSLPVLPGVATAGDIMRGLDMGLGCFKFFPATAAGGLPALDALSAPFGSVRFCPTGGIDAASAPAWLARPAVVSVGGSWLARAGMTDLEIEGAARAAVRLGLEPK